MLDKQEVTRAGQDAVVLGKRSVLISCAARRARDRRRTPSDDADVYEGASYGRLLTAVAAREARRASTPSGGVLRGRLRGRRRAAFLAPDGLAEAIVANTRVGSPRPRAGGDARRRRVGKRVTSTRVSTRFEIRTFRCSRFLASGVVSGADAKRALNA